MCCGMKRHVAYTFRHMPRAASTHSDYATAVAYTACHMPIGLGSGIRVPSYRLCPQDDLDRFADLERLVMRADMARRNAVFYTPLGLPSRSLEHSKIDKTGCGLDPDSCGSALP